METRNYLHHGEQRCESIELRLGLMILAAKSNQK